MRWFFLLTIILTCDHILYAQDRIIQSGSPFLILPPDARAAGMGTNGASTNPDYSSTFWNAGKLPFSDSSAEVGIDYTSFTPAAVGSPRQLWLSGYQKVTENHALGFSLNYFKYGDLVIRDENGYETGSGLTVSPSDFAVSITYAKKLGERVAIGVSPAYIYSGIAKGLQFDGEIKNAGSAVAVNVGLYGEIHSARSRLSYGISLNNLGSKISYGRERLKEFLPMNLRIGASGNFSAGTQSSVTVALEATKLLLPSPPVFDPEGNIIKGQNPDKSVPQAIFCSFTDAPGGFREELREVTPSFGIEFAFREYLFARTGLVYESRHKGNNRYSTFGLGFRYESFSFDVSRLQALSSIDIKNGICRFGLGILIN